MKKRILFTLGTIATVSAPIATVVSCGAETTKVESNSNSVRITAVPLFKAVMANNQVVEYIVGQTPNIDSINDHPVTTHTPSATVDVDALMPTAHLQDIINLIADIGSGATTTLHLDGKDVSLANFETNKTAQEAVNKWVEEGLKVSFPNSLQNVPVGALDLGLLTIPAETKVPLPAKGSRFELPSTFPAAPDHTRWVAQCEELAGDKWAPVSAFIRPFQDRTILVPNAEKDHDFVPLESLDTKKIAKLKFTVKLEAIGVAYRLLKPAIYTVIYEAQ